MDREAGPQLSDGWMEKAVHPAGRKNGITGWKTKGHARPPLAGRWLSKCTAVKKKYVGIHLQGHGILFLNVLFKYIL